MDETRYIRGRKVVFERRHPVEHLPFTLDVFDARDNFVEVLGRLAELSVAHAASNFSQTTAQRGAARIAALANHCHWKRGHYADHPHQRLLRRAAAHAAGSCRRVK